MKRRAFVGSIFGFLAAAIAAPAAKAALVCDTSDDAILGAKPAVFNVRDFGAMGDGYHDDGPAIKRAIKAASAVGATVYFPAGNYVTSLRLQDYDARPPRRPT